MKRLICIICCLVCVVGVHGAAQKANSSAESEYGQTYIADNLYADSVKLAENLKVPNGETLILVGKTESKRPLVEYKGKRYEVCASLLKFVAPNADGVGNTIQDDNEERYHSEIGHFFHSYSALFIILAMLLVSAVAMLFACKSKSIAAASVWLIIIPFSLLVASAMEMAMIVYCDSITWWCDYKALGFWKSMLVIFPLMVAIVLQLGIGFFYKELLEGLSESELSWKSVFYGLLCVPAGAIAMLIAAMFHLPQKTVGLVIILGGIGLFMLYAWIKNSRGLGVIMGLLFTFFSLVYAIGVCVATVTLLIVLWKMFLVILIYIVSTFALVIAFAFFNTKTGSELADSVAKEGSHTPTVFYDKGGNAHSTTFARDEANKKIDGKQ